MSVVSSFAAHSRHKAKGLENATKYIRVRSLPDARFVEFDFAIGDPSLYVELIMPPKAFEIFCQHNDVVHMTSEQMAKVDAEIEKWRYGEDTLMSRNHNRS